MDNHAERDIDTVRYLLSGMDRNDTKWIKAKEMFDPIPYNLCNGLGAVDKAHIISENYNLIKIPKDHNEKIKWLGEFFL